MTGKISKKIITVKSIFILSIIAQKMKFSIKENFISCAVYQKTESTLKL